MQGDIKVTMNLQPLEGLARKSPKVFKEAFKVGALQFLTWANNGSPKSDKKPPIRWGVLRGSSSAFVGNELVSVYKINVEQGEKPTPATSNSTQIKPGQINATWVWNTEYATKMHEWDGGWGDFTTRDTGAGAGWLLDHMQKDRDIFTELVTKEFKKRLGL